jgi:SAM-dependent methyltransferase
MPHWLLKAAAQKLLSALPGRLYDELLWRAGSLRLSPAFLDDRLAHARRHAEAWRQFRPGLPALSLEIGGGWVPVVPSGLRLLGFGRILSADLHNRFRSEARQQLRDALASGQSADFLADPAFPEHVSLLGGLATLPGASVDFIFSNNTFEHIPRPELEALLGQCRRLLAPGGLMSHYIDMADHYSYFDPRISPWHFLRFSEAQWSWIENRIQSQNRLRLPQHRQLLAEAGFQLLAEERESGPADAYPRTKVHPDFQQFTEEENRVLYAHLLAC